MKIVLNNKIKLKMCGIMGIMLKGSVNEMIKRLKFLEYRGYDSCGLAYLPENLSDITCIKTAGNTDVLKNKISDSDIKNGVVAIGHTRWASHGAPSELNAHPHSNGKVAVVHNGIVENYREIRISLESKGYIFQSQTDTEVLVHFLSESIKNGESPEEAIKSVLNKIHGKFAFIAIFSGQKNIYACKSGAQNPIVVGIKTETNENGEENYLISLSSDALAIHDISDKFIHLDKNEYAIVGEKEIVVFDKFGNLIKKKQENNDLDKVSVNLNNYQHFMLKEIHEQSSVAERIIGAFKSKILFENLSNNVNTIDLNCVCLIGCGSSYNAASVAENWFRNIGKYSVSTEIASEFIYKDFEIFPDVLYVFISQSGETADAIAAHEYVKSKGGKTCAIVNSKNSSLARAADSVVYTYAGPEISVASTKTFTSQLLVLAMMSLHITKARSKDFDKDLTLNKILEIPNLIKKALQTENACKDVAFKIHKNKNALFMSRGIYYPIATEGALKLKELSYIHAEGIAAGEMKHGTIALMEDDFPVFILAPSSYKLFEKIHSNACEVAARGAKLFIFTDLNGAKTAQKDGFSFVELPECGEIAGPIVYTIPMQLIAYYTTVINGFNVDRPRNLSKSITIE